MQQLEALLDGLKEQAVLEQELELAPPVQQSTLPVDDGHELSQTNSSYQPTSRTGFEDNINSVTSGLSDLHTSSREIEANQVETLRTELPTDLENATTTDKEKWLKALFPTIESIQITDTIAKCDGDLQRSVDELLNLSFFHDDLDNNYVPPPILRGVDGFAEPKAKKSKAKKARRKTDRDDHYLSDGTTSSGAVTPSNIWQSAADDVEFIVSRTGLSTAVVKSTYHHNHAYLALTIKDLISKEISSQATKIRSDEILQLQVDELKLELDGFSDVSLCGALLLARMIPSAAKDLLEASMRRHDDRHSGRIVAQYTPVDLSEDETPKKTARSLAPAIDPGLLAGRAGVHSIQADRAFSQASAAYRRGKSDRLMGGAAAYYAEVGHEQARRRKELIASASDALVGQQSTASSLDLHGVSVEHAVRIAKSSVENWWEGLGDRKYVVGGVGSGYKIIVGLGTHSAQGIGRIGPAVSRMLIREGWKVNVQRGEIFVEGRARR